MALIYIPPHNADMILMHTLAYFLIIFPNNYLARTPKYAMRNNIHKSHTLNAQVYALPNTQWSIRFICSGLHKTMAMAIVLCALTK